MCTYSTHAIKTEGHDICTFREKTKQNKNNNLKLEKEKCKLFECLDNLVTI